MGRNVTTLPAAGVGMVDFALTFIIGGIVCSLTYVWRLDD